MTPSPLVRLGDPLPPVALIAPDGTTTTLQAAQRGAPAVVHFMRSSSCPVCLAHIAKIQRMKDAGELGNAEIIVVAPGDRSEAETTAARVSSRAASATSWASIDGHAELGMVKGALLQHSGTLVIDAEYVLRAATLSANPLQSFSASETAAAIAEIAQASAGSRGLGS